MRAKAQILALEKPVGGWQGQARITQGWPSLLVALTQLPSPRHGGPQCSWEDGANLGSASEAFRGN